MLTKRPSRALTGIAPHQLSPAPEVQEVIQGGPPPSSTAPERRTDDSRVRPHQARRRGAAYRYLFMRPSGEDLGLLANLVDEGKLKTVTDRVFPFEQIAEAFAYLEQGHAKGKVVQM